MEKWEILCGTLCRIPKKGPKFDNGASSKIDDVLTEDGGLLHVLPLAVHLNFFDGQVGWTILDHSYFINFSLNWRSVEILDIPAFTTC